VIGVVILRFNGAKAELERAVQSLLQSSVADQITDILLVDNCSTNQPAIVDEVTVEFGSPVRCAHMDVNLGFAGGVNRGIEMLSPSCDFVLLLNDDASVEPTAVEHLVMALKVASPRVVSAVPKVFLGSWGLNGALLAAASAPLLESVGICVNEHGEAKNVGLGQPDFGQFDEPAASFGPSFGVALFRRSAFDELNVGRLNESYFLYYEDVEWNWRAWRLGFHSITVPAARAHHLMSASSRPDEAFSPGQTAQSQRSALDAAYSAKHRYIERNLLICGTTHLPTKFARKLWTTRWPRLVKARVTGRFPRASFQAAYESAARIAPTIRTRRSFSARNPNIALESVFAFWKPEPIFFDPVSYQPEYSWEALRVAAHAAELTALTKAAALQDERVTRLAIDGLLAQQRHAASTYVDLLLR
jgi:GT2 family glycosyltransferase